MNTKEWAKERINRIVFYAQKNGTKIAEIDGIENHELRDFALSNIQLTERIIADEVKLILDEIEKLANMIPNCDGSGVVQSYECEGCVNCVDDISTAPSQWD